MTNNNKSAKLIKDKEGYQPEPLLFQLLELMFQRGMELMNLSYDIKQEILKARKENKDEQ